MNKKARQFKSHLRRVGHLHTFEIREGAGETFFQALHRIKEDPVPVIIYFDDSDYVTIYASLFSGGYGLDSDKILSVLSTINSKYKNQRYAAKADLIQVSSSYTSQKSDFDPELLSLIFSTVMRDIEEDYSLIRRAVYS